MATTHQYRAERVAGIDPVQGWSLYTFEDAYDKDREPLREYVARKGDCDILLNVSEREFTPTNARFEWLVEAGLRVGATKNGVHFPMANADIDAAILGSWSAAA